MNLPHIKDQLLTHQRVLVRADLDLPPQDTTRLNTLLETLQFLLACPAKVILIGHRGRPQNTYDPDLSLSHISISLPQLTGQPVKFIPTLDFAQIKTIVATLPPGQTTLLENLRFSPDEVGNDIQFAQQLASLATFYINEAFAASHRPHASIVTLPQLLPHAAGAHFAKEVENLSRILQNPARPLLFIVSGAKPDKLDYLPAFQKLADKILIAGRLPEFINIPPSEKLIIATLTPDKLDIDQNSIITFQEEIKKAKTIVVSGPPGKFEDPLHEFGTKQIFQAVAASSAFKVAGGGDTQAALHQFQLTDKFNWISTGGGAMLDFLATGTLPGIQALLI